jgi:ADP-ribose pyrophosphatase YjhB (NUDIX family)
MATSEVNRTEVEGRLAQLRERYPDLTVQKRREEVPEALFPELKDLVAEGYTGGGYVWVTRRPPETAPLADSMSGDIDERERVLMVLGRGSTRWGLPGGGRECGESYEEAAVREVHEETGIECRVVEPFLVRKRVSVSTGHHDERLHTLWVFFDGRYEGGTIRIQPGELNGAAWFAEPPARMHPENEFRAAAWRP